METLPQTAHERALWKERRELEAPEYPRERVNAQLIWSEKEKMNGSEEGKMTRKQWILFLLAVVASLVIIHLRILHGIPLFFVQLFLGVVAIYVLWRIWDGFGDILNESQPPMLFAMIAGILFGIMLLGFLLVFFAWLGFEPTTWPGT